MGVFLRHEACDSCGSSDGRAIYEDGSHYCWVCNKGTLSDEAKQSLKEKRKGKVKVKSMNDTSEETQVVKSTKPVITEEKAKEIKEETSIQGKGFRGLKDEYTKQFGVRYSYSEETGEVIEQYYPVTQENTLTGYKIREVPKNFRSIGRTGADCELFGQFKFNRGGKYVLLVEGELCQLSAYQMLAEYNKNRGSDFETAVVSPTIGANAQKQVAAQYKFFDSFDQIIIAMDNDEAGKKAEEKLVKVLPKGKVKIMNLRYKDSNDYLEAGKGKEFIQDFYNAKSYTPVGVLASSGLYDRILEQTEIPKVPFPSFMKKLNEMFVGGMPLGYIFNIAADTGVGKTTYVNEMIYHWLFHSPHLIGVVSMELDAGQYGEVLLSRHLSRKLSLIGNVSEKLQYLKSEKIKEKANELMLKEDGSPRFFLLDNRDGSIEELQSTIEELVVSCGCKVIILDVLQDILDGLSNEEQAVFMKWLKGFIKSHMVTFVLINHMRKSENSGEMDIMGSSTIIKSAAANIILKRNKLAESEQERNTTTVTVAKNRVCGLTGPAGAAYYDNETHTLHDLDDYLNGNT